MLRRIQSRWLEPMFRMALSAKPLYETLLAEIPGDTHIFFLPAQVGDTTWICALAEYYAQSHGCRIFCIVREAQQDIPGLFPGIDSVMALDDDAADALVYYILLEGKWAEGRFVSGHRTSYVLLDESRQLFSVVFQSMPGRTLASMFTGILALPEDAPRAGALLPSASAEVESRFSDAVILFPASNSIKGIPLSFWLRLAQALQEKGLAVYVNHGGKKYDCMLPGFPVLRGSLLEAVQAGDRARFCIGIRSGIFDLLATSSARLLILYPYRELPLSEEGKRAKPGIAGDMEHFILHRGELLSDVRDLGRKDGIWNLLYDGERELAFIKAITAFVCHSRTGAIGEKNPYGL